MTLNTPLEYNRKRKKPKKLAIQRLRVLEGQKEDFKEWWRKKGIVSTLSMRIIFSTIMLLLILLTQVFAHEGEKEITNLAKAEGVGPFAALLVIAAAIILARVIRRGSGWQIINQNSNQQLYGKSNAYSSVGLPTLRCRKGDA